MGSATIEKGSLTELQNLYSELSEARAVAQVLDAKFNLCVVRALHGVDRRPETDNFCMNCGSVFSKQDGPACKCLSGK